MCLHGTCFWSFLLGMEMYLVHPLSPPVSMKIYSHCPVIAFLFSFRDVSIYQKKYLWWRIIELWPRRDLLRDFTQAPHQDLPVLPSLSACLFIDGQLPCEWVLSMFIAAIKKSENVEHFRVSFWCKCRAKPWKKTFDLNKELGVALSVLTVRTSHEWK